MDRTGEENVPEWRSDMLDLSDTPLMSLISTEDHGNSALARSLRRLAEEPDEPIAGFNSAL